MRKRRKYTNKPMMYITQPKLENPSASMQSDYRTPTNKDKRVLKPLSDKGDERTKKLLPKTSPTVKTEKEIVYGDAETVIEELQEEVEESSENIESSSESIESSSGEVELTNDAVEDLESSSTNAFIKPRTERKRFSDMTVKEKVDYFVGLPSQVPRMKCEVRTKDERIRGVITDCKDNEVYITSIKRPRNRKLSIDEITNIRLISF
ncbi:CotO family spore coat protein [Aquibacillus salsiterrae]|uniref:Spore coat CotO family protein n=1 Tax=Aquibacillus salsiterrae TaxID=2950439 RepID=A0A9X3WEW9_9BACI|nr:CotO family spore coat protein [Aquibacillus salsiterrae]MDC3417186.1 spore coat CotO family protein [Aquibacillus salsiterrae]